MATLAWMRREGIEKAGAALSWALALALACAAPAAAAGRAEALMREGTTALRRGDYSKAIAEFSGAAHAGGGSAAYFLLGYAHYQRGFSNGDPDSADRADALETVKDYARALGLDPSLSQLRQPYKLYHSLGMSYEALGSDEAAMDAFRKAFRADPSNPMLPLYAARLRFRMKELDKSAADLQLALRKARERKEEGELVRVIETDPKFSPMLASAANLAELRRYDASAPAPGAAAPKDLRDSVGAAAGAPQASKTLKKADQAVLDALGAANGDFQFERYRGAIDLYLKALALDRKSGILSPTQIAVVYERVGASYNKLGLSRQAIAVLRRCVQEAPMDAAAHYQLALAYAVSGRYQESIHALNETLESAPSKAELRRYMLLARTDSELDAVRELPAFQAALSGHLKRSLAAR